MRHSTANWAMSFRFGASPFVEASMSTTISSSASFSLKILTALIGSPTYLSSANCTVLTSPPFLINRQGVIRGRSTLHLREVLEQPGPEMMALFRMELDAEDVAGVGGAGEVFAIAGDGQLVVVAVAVEVIRVEKVEPRLGFELIEESALGDRTNVVPPHVRDGQGTGRRSRLELPDAAGDPAKAGQLALIASMGKHLHADAHP